MTPLPPKAELYLDELGRLLAPAEPVDRIEILSGVREHLESTLADLGEAPSDAAVDAALAQLGSPDAVARQAVGEAPPAAPTVVTAAAAAPVVVPVLARGWVVPTVVALLALALAGTVLLLGGFNFWTVQSAAPSGDGGISMGPLLPDGGTFAATAAGMLVSLVMLAAPVWLPAVVLLWASPRWSTRWRVVGTLLPLLTPIAALLGAAITPPLGLAGLVVGGIGAVVLLVMLARAAR